MGIHLVSACLAGRPCRYDGQARTDPQISAAVESGAAMPACPEMLGGLAVPPRPAEIVGGDGDDVLDGRARVLDDQGTDVTAEFVLGAERALAVARAVGATSATLHERSPSCGSARRYDGTFTGALVDGPGVTAALLRRHGITVQAPADDRAS